MQTLLKQVSCSQHLILSVDLTWGIEPGDTQCSPLLSSHFYCTVQLGCSQNLSLSLDWCVAGSWIQRWFLHYMRQILLQSTRLSIVTAALLSLKEPQRQHLVNLNCFSCAPGTGLNWWLSGRSILMKKGSLHLSWTCCPKYQSKVISITSGTVPELPGPGWGHGTPTPRAQPHKPTPIQQQLHFTSCVISKGSQTLSACRHPALPTCCQPCCNCWKITCTALFLLQSWSRGWGAWRTSLASSGAHSGSSGSRQPSRTWSKCWAQENECQHYLHQVAISKVVLIKILCYTVCNFIEYKH